MILNSDNNNKDKEDLKTNNALSSQNNLQKKKLPFSSKLAVSTTALTNRQTEIGTQQDVRVCLPYTPMLCESPTKSISTSSSKRTSFDAISPKTSTISTTSIHRNKFLFFFHYLPTTSRSATSLSSLNLSHNTEKNSKNCIPCTAPIIQASQLMNNKCKRKNASVINVQTTPFKSKTIDNNKVNIDENYNQDNVFSFRTTSVAKTCSTFRRSSLTAINISSFSNTKDSDYNTSLSKTQKHLKINDSCEETSRLSLRFSEKEDSTSNIIFDLSTPTSPTRKKISNANIASRAVRKKISTTKLVLRKISQSSILGLSNIKHNFEFPNQRENSENEHHVDMIKLESFNKNHNELISSLVKRSSKSLKESLKKKKFLRASLSWDLEQR